MVIHISRQRKNVNIFINVEYFFIFMLNQALFYFLNDYDLLYPYNCLNLWRFHDGKDRKS